MKILSIGGTRPQFVKMAVMVKAFEAYNRDHHGGIDHRLIHSGQHYDPLMSDIFFSDLDMPQPHMSLGVPPGAPGVQTASMLASIEAALMKWRPDAVIAYGDTNSTLATALAAVKLHIPLIHLEAGLRSFNRRMQEEINRIIADHVADVLLCPTRSALHQLEHEGLADRAYFAGDVMLDAVQLFGSKVRHSTQLEAVGLAGGLYALVTLHRAENTDDVRRLGNVVGALEQLEIPVVLPLHPRLKHLLGTDGCTMLASHAHIHLIEPVGYLEMLCLEQRARLILTDSGGVQKEAYFVGKPCVTMRDETEWEETLQGGWNRLVGTETDAIVNAIATEMQNDGGCAKVPRNLAAFGDGCAGARCVDIILDEMRAG